MKTLKAQGGFWRRGEGAADREGTVKRRRIQSTQALQGRPTAALPCHLTHRPQTPKTVNGEDLESSLLIMINIDKKYLECNL